MTLLRLLFCLIFALSTANANADCTGCCSRRGGVICFEGITLCSDGTPLSEICQAKDCNVCPPDTESLSTATQDKIPTTPARGNRTNQSFNRAKKVLMKEVYFDRRTTFYCECLFTDSGGVLHTNGYIPQKTWNRAHRLEWEHIVPAHAFGQSFREWREGHPECVDSKGEPFKGRNCAGKVNIQYRCMEADMYNLVPAVGEINALRSNYSFAMIPGEATQFGTCKMIIEDRKAQPPPGVRGDIARTYFYMDWAYPGHGVVSNKNRKLFQAWDKQDPVDAWECERAKRIEAIQGNENPMVKNPCMESGLW